MLVRASNEKLARGERQRLQLLSLSKGQRLFPRCEVAQRKEDEFGEEDECETKWGPSKLCPLVQAYRSNLNFSIIQVKNKKNNNNDNSTRRPKFTPLAHIYARSSFQFGPRRKRPRRKDLASSLCWGHNWVASGRYKLGGGIIISLETDSPPPPLLLARTRFDLAGQKV